MVRLNTSRFFILVYIVATTCSVTGAGQVPASTDTCTGVNATPKSPISVTMPQPTSSFTDDPINTQPGSSPASTPPPVCSKNCTMRLGYHTMVEHSASWSKCQDTVMIGRIYYTIDRANNKTITSTSYAAQVTFTSSGSEVTSPGTDLVGNGSQVLTRTDVDANGSVLYVDGTVTIVYPTGVAEFPIYYAWNGTLPYITSGTTSCVTAESPSFHLSTETYTVTGSSTTYTGTLNLDGTSFATTPLPEVTDLPTRPVFDIDEQDPKGWTYCIHWGDDTPISDDFVSFFPGSVFDRLYYECVIERRAVSPAIAVDAAAFLLDETTTYV